MKLYTILAFALIATLIFATASVFAEDNVSLDESSDTETSTLDQETSMEISDDLNESVSGFKIGWEKFKLAFTFNNEKKATQELKIARLRLIQAKVAAQNGNTEAMQSALDAHDKLIEKVKIRVNAIDGDSTKDGVKLSAAKLVGLERAIEVHETRISKLSEILASANLTDEQRAKVEERLSKVEENTAKLREIEVEKKIKIKAKLETAGLTEEEADLAIEKLENVKNLASVKKKVAEIKLENKKRIAEKIKERIKEKSEPSEEELEGEDVSESELEVESETEVAATANLN